MTGLELGKFIESVARQAGGVLKDKFRGKLAVSLKADESLVTEADLASQATILAAIKTKFPDDQILAEEQPDLLQHWQQLPKKPLWIIDPLDGTTNFANGFDYYCVSIARATFVGDQWRIEAGAVFVPGWDLMFSAVRGNGALRNGIRILPMADRPRKEFSRCFLATGFAYHKGEELLAEIARFSKVADKCQSIRRAGAAALDLALVADGVFDAFWEKGLQPWDIAASWLMLEELGARVCRYSGADFEMPASDMIAGRGEVVDTILNIF